jgi:cytochrome P450
VRVVLHADISAWLLTHPDHIAAAACDPRLSSDPAQLGKSRAASAMRTSAAGSTVKFSIMAMDPPGHTRLRRLLAAAFTPGRVQALQPRIQEITDELVDRIAPLGHADIVESVALPLPLRVICELLGIPFQERSHFEDLSKEMFQPPTQAQTQERILAARRDLYRYLRTLIRRKAADPGDDLVTALIGTQDDSKMTGDELVEAAVLLLVAGYETTVSLIGTGTLALLQHPDQLAILRRQPGLMPQAVEEMLRYDGPLAIGVTRYTTCPVTIAGVRIPAGERVVLGLGAANHDPGRFPQPGALDIARDERSHLAFGHGPHYCLGAPLARLEAQIAFGTLLSRLEDLTLAIPVSSLRWRQTIFRALDELPVSFSPAVRNA